MADACQNSHLNFHFKDEFITLDDWPQIKRSLIAVLSEMLNGNETRSVILKMGGRGVLLVTTEYAENIVQVKHIPVQKVEKFVNCTGAGKFFFPLA